MKELQTVLVISIALFCLTACYNGKNAIIFKQNSDHDGYVSIIWEDREYLPYCSITENRGVYLGNMENDEDIKIYEYKGQSNQEWIIDYLNGEMMLYKEINVKKIPDNLTSEYEWNN